MSRWPKPSGNAEQQTAPPVTLTPTQFRKKYGFSNAELYKEWAAGRGPGFILVGERKRLITHEHEIEWVAECERRAREQLAERRSAAALRRRAREDKRAAEEIERRARAIERRPKRYAKAETVGAA